MRSALEQAKRVGAAFDEAWLGAVDAVLWPSNRQVQMTWRDVLRDPAVIEAFRAAYRDEPSPWALLSGLSFDELAAGLHELEAA